MKEATIRRWEMEDKEGLMHLCNTVDRTFLSDRLPYPYKEEDAVAWLTMVSEQEGKEGVFRAIVFEDEIIGSISVEKNGNDEGDIGYMLLTNYWSKGIMTKAVSVACHIAFEELNLHQITGSVYEPNVASTKVLEKNGFVYERRINDGTIMNGERHHINVYKFIKKRTFTT